MYIGPGRVYLALELPLVSGGFARGTTRAQEDFNSD